MPLHHRESQTARRSSRVCCPFTTHIQVSECLNAQSSHLVTQHVVSEYTLITSRVALYTGVHKYVIIASRNTRSTRTRKHSPRSRAAAQPRICAPLTSYLICYSIYRIEEASMREASIREVHILCMHVCMLACLHACILARYTYSLRASLRASLRILASLACYAPRFASRSARLHSPIHLPDRQRLPLCGIVPTPIIRRTGGSRGIVKVTLERVGPPGRDRGHLLHGLPERGVVRDR